MKRRSWAERLEISLTGNPETKFYTLGNLPVAIGYSRVVIGGRGAYVEFEPEHICKENFHIPKFAEYKLKQSMAYYHEYRSNDKCFVKAYFQQMGVSYADYKVGKWYIDPAILKTDKFENLLLPLYDNSQPNEERKITLFDV